MSRIEMLERAVLTSENIAFPVDYGSAVVERYFTATGFVVTYNGKLGLPPIAEDDVYGEVGARLNDTIEIGFIFRVTQGRVDFLEGYTFGDELWPEEISSFELLPNPRAD
jgi:hypothetical protein